MKYIGDAIKIMSGMDSDSYGAVVTSPPYNIGLAKMMIGITGAKSKILDPFIGSGTTELAAKELGLECDGIDIRNWND